MALPIDGELVTGIDLDRTTQQWQEYCLTYIGFSPDANVLKGSRLQTSAITSHLAAVESTYNTPQAVVVQYACAVALLLFGGLMCLDSSGNYVSLLHLSKLEDIETARNYSWGSAVLAFLYPELCNASTKAKRQLVGCCNCYRFGHGHGLRHFVLDLVPNGYLWAKSKWTTIADSQQHHMVLLEIVSTLSPQQFGELSESYEKYWMRCRRISSYDSRMTWTRMSLWLTPMN
ncbi:UNVERIFIED_CONTAM: hypothetical protein Sindi_2274500 [Sesamum indicum]